MKAYSHHFPSSKEAQKWRTVSHTRAQKQVPGWKCFPVVWRESHAFHPSRGFTQNLLSQQMNPCARSRTCKLLSTMTWGSFPNTSEEPQPMANRQKISTRLTESQPYPNKLDLSFLNQQQNRNEFWGQSTVSPVACWMLVIKTALAKGRRAKGRDRPFQKENIHYCVSKPGIMRSRGVGWRCQPCKLKEPVKGTLCR